MHKLDAPCAGHKCTQKYKGLNFESLQGDKQGISSIRVNLKYRIEFTVTDTGLESFATVCNILELSNHYK